MQYNFYHVNVNTCCISVYLLGLLLSSLQIQSFFITGSVSTKRSSFEITPQRDPLYLHNMFGCFLQAGILLSRYFMSSLIYIPQINFYIFRLVCSLYALGFFCYPFRVVQSNVSFLCFLQLFKIFLPIFTMTQPISTVLPFFLTGLLVCYIFYFPSSLFRSQLI